MKRKVNINDESIESVVKKDYKEALVDYILNAFEADATEVAIVTSVNELAGVDEIRIIDNGTGIDYSTLEQTFESFLSSSKLMRSKPINLGRNKGRGRYAFISFANTAIWQTVYKDGDDLRSYSIRISTGAKDYIDTDEETSNVTDEDVNTGTTVILQGINTLTQESLSIIQIEKPLLNAFASFLYLNRSKGYKITIDGKAIDYTKLIDTALSEDKKISINEHEFTIYFIKWIENIKSRYFFYFLDSSSQEKYNKHTKFNNNAIDFCHSVYIESEYFNDFKPFNDSDTPEEQFVIISERETENQRSETFKKLLITLNEFVEAKQRAFVKMDADRLVEKIKAENGFPKFGETAFDREREEDFVNVVKEIYCLEPRIFKGVKKEPRKSMLGFLNLLLSSDERENVLKIIEEITQLSPQERADFAAILQFTKLSNVLRTVKLISCRKNKPD